MYRKTKKDKISDFPKATKGISQRNKKVPQSPCWRAGTISLVYLFHSGIYANRNGVIRIKKKKKKKIRDKRKGKERKPNKCK